MTSNQTNQFSLQVKFFGHCRTLAGTSESPLQITPPATAADVVEAACREFPPLRTLSGKLLVAVNETYALPHQPVQPGDEVAIFPPVSGGQEDRELAEADFFVRITYETIDSETIVARLLRGADGAVVTFDGVVRNHTKGRTTRYLEYEAYPGMALKIMRQVAEEARAQWPIDRIALVHRLGRLEIGESSVVIVVTSAHRQPAFEACRLAIDRLKQIVPIWKREYFEDGDVWVEGEMPAGMTG